MHFNVCRIVRRQHGLAACGIAAHGVGHPAGPFVRNGAGRVLVPARIAVVAGLLVLAYFHDGEHAAHFDIAEGALPGHHRQGVVR